jgi:hypothetical protein
LALGLAPAAREVTSMAPLTGLANSPVSGASFLEEGMIVLTPDDFDAFDLVIEPLVDGTVIIDVRLDAGLDALADALPHHDDDRAGGVICGGCAKEVLGRVLINAQIAAPAFVPH